MIIDFKRQTCASIGNFLRNLGQRNRIFSLHFKNTDICIDSLHFYIYATKTEMVVVMIDQPYSLDNEYKETVSEDYHGLDSPKYVSETGDRQSPVFQLKQVMESLESRLYDRWGNEMPRLWGVVVSTAVFTNKDQFLNRWHRMGISVFDRQDDILKYINLPFNNNKCLPGAAFAESFFELFPEDYKRQASQNFEQDEFERMISEFIEREYNNTHNAKKTTDDEDEETDDDEIHVELDFNLDSDDEDEDETDDGTGGETDDATDDATDSLQSTFDEIEVNNNYTVRVEVLKPMSDPMSELNKLVGCQNIKQHIDRLIMLNKYNERMLALDPKAKVHALSLHSIFFGAPGTGKTTVCKIMGSLLHQAGMLSRGHVVVANRSTFIGNLWGDEERTVRQVVEKATGGVLMIDEAYLLNGDNRNDPGKMVLPLLMDILSNEQQRDLAIVLCGYKQPMLRLLELNPGLESRFPNRFEFEDFSVDELLDITQRRVGEYHYSFTPQAWERYRQAIEQAYAMRDPQSWGNARFVANQLEHIYIAHAQRCIEHGISEPEAFFSLTPDDIQPIAVPRAKARIGF